MWNLLDANPIVINCTFSLNTALVDGGGIYNELSSNPTVTNCIFWGNVDDADASAGGPFTDESAQIHIDSGTPAVTYSCIQGLVPGGDFDSGANTNNIGDAELRATWTDPDFDPNHRAVYYVRVLEIPTPTWQAYDANFYGTTMPPQVPLSHQERAYTSPIWYTPGT